MKPKHARPATKADETPEFKELWEIWQAIKSEYDGRASARDAFFRHVWWRDAEPRDIVDAAREYVRITKPDARRLLLENWLDRGIYEDLAEQGRAYQRRVAEAQERAHNVVPISQSIDPERRAQAVARARAAVRGMAV